MNRPDRPGERRLLSLGEASRILGVKGVTLRQWANRGMVQAFRTQGGHRRFLWKQINDLSRRGLSLPASQSQPGEEIALRRVQRRLRRAGHAQQAWRQGIKREVVTRFRLFGRRLLSLLVRSGSQAHASRRVLDEARLLGKEYGTAMASQGHPLTQTLSAFLFFRDSVLDTVPTESRRRVMAVTDQVLMGIAEAHEGPAQGAAP